MSAHATTSATTAEPASSAAPPVRRRRSLAKWSPGGALGITLLALFVGQLVAATTLLLGADKDPTWLDGMALILADVVTLAVIVFFARRGADHLGAATFGLRRTDPTAALGWALLAYIGYVGFTGLWLLLVGGGAEGGGGGATSAGGLSPLVVALLFVTVVVGAPIVEEIMFRGYLFAALTRWKGPWPAAIVSGALFGLAHFLVHPPAIWLPLAIMGFLLALIFWITGSLLPCIALHAANNALAMSLSLEWTWQVPLAVVGIPALLVVALAPIAKQRAPQVAA